MAHRIFWKVFRLTLGWILIVVGFVGLFVPILQGLLLMFGGISILAAESRWARELLGYIKAKLGSLFTKRSSTETDQDTENEKRAR